MNKYSSNDEIIQKLKIKKIENLKDIEKMLKENEEKKKIKEKENVRKKKESSSRIKQVEIKIKLDEQKKIIEEERKEMIRKKNEEEERIRKEEEEGIKKEMENKSINKDRECKEFIPNCENYNIIEQNLYKKSIFKIEQKKKDLLDSINIISNKEGRINTCIICTEEFVENKIENPKLDCGNYVHGTCFIEYINEELNNNRFPIRCLICTKNKRHEINYKMIIDCLLFYNKKNLAIKLENMSLNYLARNNPDEVSFCPTAGCNYMCFYDKNEYHLDCPLCKKSYCLKCKSEWHENKTCKEYQLSIKKDDDIKFEEFVKGNNYKKCPKCKRWVEKISGCNHIICPCGIHFCYGCGEIIDTDDPYSHRCPNNLNNNNFYNMNMMNNMNNMNNINEEDDIIFEEYAKVNNYKKCPNCKRWIEKISGSNHIKCLCRTHFCFACGGIRDPDNPYSHHCPNNLNNNNFNNMNMMNNMNNMNNTIFNRYLNQGTNYFMNMGMNMNFPQNINNFGNDIKFN